MEARSMGSESGENGNNSKSRIRAFIFDMDGTLLETTCIDYKAWIKLFNDYNREFISFEEYRKLLGIKSAEVIKEYLGFGNEMLKQALEKRLGYIKDILEEEGLRTVLHAEEFLQAARSNYKMALATGARREKMETVLGRTDLRKYFDTIVTSDDVEKGKPDPSLFLEAARQLGIHPSEAIVVEDAVNGVTAARRAGMKCIAITTTTPFDQLQQADMIIHSYRNLEPLEIVERISMNGAPGTGSK